MKSNDEKKHLISVLKLYDWVHVSSVVNIKANASFSRKERSGKRKPDPVIAKTKLYQYHTVSDGLKTVYTNADELTEFGNQGILDPASVSYVNLFLNGMLQPPKHYVVEPGKLTLLDQAPAAGSTLTLQFITIFV